MIYAEVLNTQFREVVTGVYQSKWAYDSNKLMSSEQGQELINSSLFELVSQAGIDSEKFSSAIEAEKKSIDKFFKYGKPSNDKANLEFRQSTLNSKRMLNTVKNAVVNKDATIRFGDAEKITPLAMPVICRIIDDLRLDSGLVIDDTISDFGRLDPKRNKSYENLKGLSDAEHKEMESLGKWTNDIIERGFTRGYHMDEVLGK